MSFSKILLILNCSCEQSSRLVSESLDRELTASERWAVRMHHLVCGPCRKVAKQLRRIRAALSDLPQDVRTAMSQDAASLSPSAKQRIADSMRDTQ